MKAKDIVSKLESVLTNLSSLDIACERERWHCHFALSRAELSSLVHVCAIKQTSIQLLLFFRDSASIVSADDVEIFISSISSVLCFWTGKQFCDYTDGMNEDLK